MFKPLEVLVISSQEHPNRYMGIRSRIFLIIFGLLSLSISITYIVAERDLVSTLKLQIVNELEKQANLLVSSIDTLNKFNSEKEADIVADKLAIASNSRVTFIRNNGLNPVKANVIKYVCRYLTKGKTIEDLEKIKHYCDLEIEHLKDAKKKK